MQDRISTYQGRVTLTPVSGQVNTYDMVRADSPEQTGTPLNTENLLSQRASAAILTLAGVEPENPSEAFIQLSKVLYPLKKEAVGIASGSYTGTGTSTTGVSFSETFTFTPMVIMVIDSTAAAPSVSVSTPAGNYMFIAVQGVSQLSRIAHNSTETPVDVTWDDYTITLANGTGLNVSGHIYKWVVIGQIPDTGVIDEDEIDWEAAVLALIDPTLTLSDHAADAKAVGDAMDDLKSALEVLPEITGYPVIPVLNWTSGIQISNSNGAEVSNASYKATDYIAIDPTFGNVSVEASYSSGPGDTNKNAWYDESKAFISAFTWNNNSTVTLTPPPTARYMRLSASLITTIRAKVLYKQSIVDILKSAFGLDVPEFVDGYYINYQTGAVVANDEHKYVMLPVNIFRGGKITGTTGIAPNAIYGVAFYTKSGAFISGSRPTVAGTYKWTYTLTVPENASYLGISLRTASAAYWVDPQYEFKAVFENLQTVFENVEDLEADILDINNVLNNVFTFNSNNWVLGTLNPGTGTQGASTNRVLSPYINAQKNDIVSYSGNENCLIVYEYDESDGYISDSPWTGGNKYTVSSENAAYVRILIRKDNTNSTISTSEIPSLVAGVTLKKIIPKEIYDINKLITGKNDDVIKKAENARHAPGNPTLLTLLHFSDLHHDLGGALERIMSDAEDMATLIDDKICTGDMVANTAEQIASWWDSSVMTCIGNHETASYDASTGYNWTALSMADRDAYYIAPFESGWGITHTSGTSYYYKDYSTQKVRLIVMDAMLYSGTPGAEAETQTAWLANLLSDAITNDLHVLIAIHAPHGGATAKECSFSRYGQGTMPTYSDCNTPDVVIQTVATALSNGLHFIGYIVGHTHQDNIWDAEGDGSQLMYCVTCAAVNNPNQWKNSDQYRGVDADAYNLVTIDTTNTLVKLVRGGGADIDDHMRTRKGICFNYTTGTVVGEVL